MALPQVGVEAVIQGMGQFESNAKKITGAYSEIDSGADKLGKGSASLSTQFVDLGNSLLKFGAIAGTVVVGAVATLGAALTGFAIGGIQKAADLDQKMADIAATMGIAKEQAQGLKQLALDLALDPNLTVSATQAAEAIEVLAANGADLVDELGNVTEAGRELTTQVVAMSNATGADFALSAAIATDAASIFKIAAEDMGKVVDGAAGVMVASKFDAQDYALALANAGSIASGAGVDIEDFNTIIAATASQFASGSDSGTALKSMLAQLADPTNAAKKLMEEYGISLFDSEGNMRAFSEITGQLTNAFTGLSDEQKLNTAITLAGRDGHRTLLGLIGLSAEEFAKLSAEVNKSGQGLKAAATRVDSFKGAMDIFGGVIEAIQIQVGDKFLPVLRGITVGFTDLAAKAGPMVVNFFGKIADAIGGAINLGSTFASEFMKGFSSNFGNDFGFIGQIFGGIEEVLDNFLGEGTMEQIFDLFDAMGLLVKTVFGDISSSASSVSGVLSGAFASAIDFLANNLLPALTTAILFVNEHWAEFKGAIIGVGAVLAGAAIAAIVVAIGSAIAALATPIGAIIAAAALLGAAWAGNWGDIQGITKATIKFIQKAVDNIIKVLQPIIKKVIPELIEIWQILSKKAQEIWPYIQKIITKVMEAIQDIIKSVTKNIQSIWSSHGDEMKSIWSAYWDVVFRILKTTLENILDLIKLTLQVITGDWKGAWDTIKDIASRTWEGIRDNINSVLQIISSIIKATMGDISGQIKAAWDGIKSTISSALSAIQTNITTGWNNIKTTIETAINSIKTAVQNGFSSLQSSISTAMNNVISNVTTAWNNIVNTFKNKATEAVNGAMAAINQLPGKISALAGQLASAAATMMQGLINGIIAKATEVTNAVINTVSGAISSLVSSITSGSLATSLINAGKSILNKVIDGVRSITNLASELVTKVTAGVSSLVTAITSGSLAASLLNAGRSILNKLIDGVKGVTNLASELINKVSDAISNLITSITSGSIFSKLRNAGQSVIEGIIEGMQDNASAIWDMLKEIWDDALGNFMGLIGASSPSKVMMAVGGDIMKGLEIGMASMAPAINAQFQASMLSPVASVAGPALGSSSVVNNTYQFYNGGNNINTQFDEAKLEALIIRTIQKNLP